MFKKIMTRLFIGAFASIVYCDFVAIFISFAIGDGNFYPVSGGFSRFCSTQTGAVLFQFITMFIFGAICGVSSLIFEKENWSLLKRTVIHFLILTSSFTIVVFLGGWINKSIWGILSPLSFFVIYAIIWFTFYFKTRREISEMNDILKK